MDKASDNVVSTSKILINCSERITDQNPTTDGWLDGISYLKTIPFTKASMSHKKILEGILNKSRSVVVKVSDNTENLLKEYDTYLQLRDKKVNGIVHYYCYFECEDSLGTVAETLRNGKTLCQGVGSTLRVLVMEYIPNKSMAQFNWSSYQKAILTSIKQVVCTCVDAFIKFGFIHGDLHCNNILIKRSKTSEIDYEFTKVKTNGIKIFLMDFELSETGKDITYFYKHMYYVFWNSITKYFRDHLDPHYMLQVQINLLKLYETAIKPEDALKFIDIIG